MLDYKTGAKGWNFDQWTGEFYPHDLPKEWRLPYYANEFHTVLVPEHDWLHASLGEFEQWSMDVPDEFEFFLAMSMEAFVSDQKKIAKLLSSIRQFVCGCVVEFDATTKMSNDVIKNLRKISREVPVYLDYRNLNSECDNRYLDYFDPCWRPGFTFVQAPKNRFMVALHPSQQIVSPRELRQEMDEIRRTAVHQTAVYVFFEHPAGAINCMKNTNIIANLS